MSTIEFLSDALLWIIRSGVVFRVTLIFIKMNDDEQLTAMKKRFKNTVVFYILAESLGYIVKLISNYYS